MTIKDELIQNVRATFNGQWSVRDGRRVPEPDDLKLSNDSVKIDGTVLYADISGSTRLVDNYRDWFAAEVYKTFLYCAARIIRTQGGTITAYDGDRIMAVFFGDSKNSDAARTALKINYARVNLINPAIKKQYPNTTFTLEHTVGIDTSSLYIARTGIKGFNDLVWVGRAANHAAKMCELSPSYPSRITKEVFDSLHDKSKYGSKTGEVMWERVEWNTMNRPIYRSTWYWDI